MCAYVLWICICVYSTCTQVFLCVRVHPFVFVYVDMCVCMQTFGYLDAWVNMHVCVNICYKFCVQVFVFIHIFLYSYMYLCVGVVDMHAFHLPSNYQFLHYGVAGGTRWWKEKAQKSIPQKIKSYKWIHWPRIEE